MVRYAFRFDRPHRLLGVPFGVTPRTTHVDVADGRFRARFGPWVVDTPLENVTGAERSGPFKLAKTAGPAHVSAADRGLTFATNDQAGACIRFAEPVRGFDPAGALRHPALTVTVERVDDLIGAVTKRFPEEGRDRPTGRGAG